MINFVRKNWEKLLLAVFILIAGVLRFYHITRLQFFTYDQARDALFVKRMIVDHEFRLLGTQTSLPGMYLPPFYYYTIAPILWISGLNPVGIDIYSALIGVLSVPFVYFVANRIFGRPAGVFSAGLFAVSPLVVELTRRAWNPNTLPFFILITFYFVWRYFKEGKVRDFLLAFGFYGYCLSLHFGAWLLMPLFILIWVHVLFKKKLGWLELLGGLGLILLFTCPLLIFEIRHNFFLTSQAKIFFFDGKHVGLPVGSLIESFFSSLIALFTVLISGKIMIGYGAPFEFSGRIKDLFNLTQPISVVAQKPFSLSFQWWGILLFFLILLFSFKEIYRNKKLKSSLFLIWAWVLWGIFTSRLYTGKFFFFYYLYLFPAPILLFGFLFKKTWEVKNFKALVFFSFVAIIVFHLYYTTVFSQGWRDINDLKAVAKVIGENAGVNDKFNIATIQKETDRWDRNSVDYRYFVETFNYKRALDWYPEDYQKAEFLFVVSEGGRTEVLKSKIMEIEEFSPEKIIGQWQSTKEIVVYKLSKKGKK